MKAKADKIFMILFSISLAVFTAMAVIGSVSFIYSKVTGEHFPLLYGYKGDIAFISFLLCLAIAFISNQVEKLLGKHN